VPAAGWTRFEPCRYILWLVAHSCANLEVFRPLAKKPPPPDGCDRKSGNAGHIMFIQKCFESCVYSCHL